MTLTLEKIGIAQEAELRELAVHCYVDTYQKLLTKEEIQRRVERNHTQKEFTGLLTKESEIFWGIFEVSKILGYLQLSTGGKSGSVNIEGYLELFRIYVHPEHQGSGLGKIMMKKAEEAAANYKGLWLHCYDQNKGAIEFYLKLGFKIEGKDEFTIIEGLPRIDLVLMKGFN